MYRLKPQDDLSKALSPAAERAVEHSDRSEWPTPMEFLSRHPSPTVSDAIAVAHRAVAKLQLNPDGSLVQLSPGDWFVCFVPGINRQWWHRFVNERHKHVFAIRPVGDGKWTLFEPWWTRLLTATITSEQAKKFLRWGAEGDVLLAREAIPGAGGQFRGWMNCAALAAYMLGRRYWVWTPHGLFRRLLREPNVCQIDVSALLEHDLAKLGSEESRDVLACEECRPDHPKHPEGAAKPFCMHCGRQLADWPKV
ncbi:MAG: hypothetical protein GC190_18680 [Alphaproteobacteria bacterium]|nr:hypothetical protein [Alphaproteobacteria bacterium]